MQPSPITIHNLLAANNHNHQPKVSYLKNLITILPYLPILATKQIRQNHRRYNRTGSNPYYLLKKGEKNLQIIKNSLPLYLRTRLYNEVRAQKQTKK